jgi:hypothetical protein
VLKSALPAATLKESNMVLITAFSVSALNVDCSVLISFWVQAKVTNARKKMVIIL